MEEPPNKKIREVILLLTFLFSLSIFLYSQELSRIEKSFSSFTYPSKLKQFGYEVFSYRSQGFSLSQKAPVGGDYILGTDDELIIDIWGEFEKEERVKIDRDGNIFLHRIGKLFLAGKRFSEAEKILKKKLLHYYKNINIDVSLGKMRRIRVFVVGEVKKPGSYEVSPISNILDILYLSGGPTKDGTLRNIKVIQSSGKKLSFDLYPFLLTGKIQNIYISDGDVIFVPLIGKVAGIWGEVKKPGIYEIKSKTSLENLIEMAGGFLPSASISKIQVERIEKFKKRKLVDLLPFDKGLSHFLLKNYDLVKIFHIGKKIYNYISLEGKVKNPGEYEFREGMKLSNILKEDSLLPEASLEQAEIIRMKSNGEMEKIIFSPKDIFQGKKDFKLSRWDRIIIHSAWKLTGKVKIEGEVKFPGEYTLLPGEKLSSLIERAGGYTKEAFLKGALFTRKSIKKEEKENLKILFSQYKSLIQNEEKNLDRGNMFLLEKAKALLEELPKREPSGRMTICLEPLNKLKNSTYDIMLENGDYLYIPKIPSTVHVMGEVKNPSFFLFKKGKQWHYYLKEAGGYTHYADRGNVYLIKPDGSATTILRSIEPGDTIVVPVAAREKIGQILRDLFKLQISFIGYPFK